MRSRLSGRRRESSSSLSTTTRGIFGEDAEYKPRNCGLRSPSPRLCADATRWRELIERRHEQGLTQTQLAEIPRIVQVEISRIERDRRTRRPRFEGTHEGAW